MSVRRSRGRLWAAWLLFAAGALLVLFFGSDDFSAAYTGKWLGPLIEWLFPDWTAAERWKLHYQLRTLAHPIEYGVLSLLAFHAVFVSLETLLARIAALALLLVLAVAALDEVRQGYSATRTGSIWDVSLDLVGACTGLALAVLLIWRRDRKKHAENATP